MALTDLINPLHQLEEGLTKLFQPLEQLDLTFRKLQLTLGRFVEMISPGQMLAFNLQMRNLEATIGVALVPAFNTLTKVVKEIGGVIYPLMQQLAPVIDRVVASLGETLTTAISAVVSTIEATMPQIEKVLKILTDSFQWLIAQVIKLTAVIAQIVGMGQVVNKIIEGLERPRGPGAAAVPWSPGVSQIPDIAKQMAAASFIAKGGEGDAAKTTNDYLKELIEDLKAIREGKGLHQTIESAIRSITKFPVSIVESLLNQNNGAGRSVPGSLRDTIDRGPTGLGADLANGIRDFFSNPLFRGEFLNPGSGRIPGAGNQGGGPQGRNQG